MKWSRSIAFALPLRAVVAQPAAAWVPTELPPETEALLRRREEQAFERGLAEGERRLGELVLRQRTEVQQLHIGVLDSLRQAVGGLLRDTEAALIELAFDVAQKVVAEVPLDAPTVAARVRAALAAARDATDLVVQLHPDDLDLLRRLAPDVLEPSATPGKVRWIPAPDIARGGCIVRSELGIIDARRENCFARLQQAVEP